jgi:hypothetical protein
MVETPDFDSFLAETDYRHTTMGPTAPSDVFIGLYLGLLFSIYVGLKLAKYIDRHWYSLTMDLEAQAF